jgi:aquaporin Z
MSLNPARTFGSAFAGNVWTGIWLYFVAPMAGALGAAEVFLVARRELPCAKLCHDPKDCLFCGRDAEPIPHFPKAVET